MKVKERRKGVNNKGEIKKKEDVNDEGKGKKKNEEYNAHLCNTRTKKNIYHFCFMPN